MNIPKQRSKPQLQTEAKLASAPRSKPYLKYALIAAAILPVVFLETLVEPAMSLAYSVQREKLRKLEEITQSIKKPAGLNSPEDIISTGDDKRGATSEPRGGAFELAQASTKAKNMANGAFKTQPESKVPTSEELTLKMNEKLLEKLKLELKTANSSLTQTKTKISEAKKKLQELDKMANASMKESLTKKPKAELAALEKDQGTIEANIKNLNKQIADVKNEIANAQNNKTKQKSDEAIEEANKLAKASKGLPKGAITTGKIKDKGLLPKKEPSAEKKAEEEAERKAAEEAKADFEKLSNLEKNIRASIRQNDTDSATNSFRKEYSPLYEKIKSKLNSAFYSDDASLKQYSLAIANLIKDQKAPQFTMLDLEGKTAIQTSLSVLAIKSDVLFTNIESNRRAESEDEAQKKAARKLAAKMERMYSATALDEPGRYYPTEKWVAIMKSYISQYETHLGQTAFQKAFANSLGIKESNVANFISARKTLVTTLEQLNLKVKQFDLSISNASNSNDFQAGRQTLDDIKREYIGYLQTADAEAKGIYDRYFEARVGKVSTGTSSDLYFKRIAETITALSNNKNQFQLVLSGMKFTSATMEANEKSASEVLLQFNSLSPFAQYAVLKSILPEAAVGKIKDPISASSWSSSISSYGDRFAALVDGLSRMPQERLELFVEKLGGTILTSSPINIASTLIAINGHASAFSTASDFEGLQGYYNELPEKYEKLWQSFYSLKERVKTSSRDLTIQLPDEREDVMVRLAPQSYVILGFPRSLLEQPLVRNDAVTLNSVYSLERGSRVAPLNYDVAYQAFFKKLIALVIEQPLGSIQLPAILLDTGALAPSMLPKIKGFEYLEGELILSTNWSKNGDFSSSTTQTGAEGRAWGPSSEILVQLNKAKTTTEVTVNRDSSTTVTTSTGNQFTVTSKDVKIGEKIADFNLDVQTATQTSETTGGRTSFTSVTSEEVILGNLAIRAPNGATTALAFSHDKQEGRYSLFLYRKTEAGNWALAEMVPLTEEGGKKLYASAHFQSEGATSAQVETQLLFFGAEGINKGAGMGATAASDKGGIALLVNKIEDQTTLAGILGAKGEELSPFLGLLKDMNSGIILRSFNVYYRSEPTSSRVAGEIYEISKNTELNAFITAGSQAWNFALLSKVLTVRGTFGGGLGRFHSRAEDGSVSDESRANIYASDNAFQHYLMLSAVSEVSQKLATEQAETNFIDARAAALWKFKESEWYTRGIYGSRKSPTGTG
ncbi:MAG: hypothetical protein ABIH99_05580, partial [Candidatus Micrarchaeota archaeon]